MICIVALQLSVPIMATLQDSPSRLGWQMYSGIGELPEISVESSSGEITDLSFTDFTAASRPELNWNEYLAAFVCNQIPDAVTVHLTYSTDTHSFECK